MEGREKRAELVHRRRCQRAYVRMEGGHTIAQRLQHRRDGPALAKAAVESRGVFTPGGVCERQASVNAPPDQANTLEGRGAEAPGGSMYL